MTNKLMIMGLIPFLLTACNIDNTQLQSKDIEDRYEQKGRIYIPLTATSTSGVTYQIEMPTVLLQHTEETMEINMNGETELETSLQEGIWTMEINDGWKLHKEVDGDLQTVEAEMTTDNPQSFSIFGGETTLLTIAFKIIEDDTEEVIEFQYGDLEITIEIDDQNTETEPEPEASDLDNDGFSVEDGDCNDQDATINPDAEEICDQLDNNCNGVVDDEAIDATLWYLDSDGDGYPGNESLYSCLQPAGYLEEAVVDQLGFDCMDHNNSINPAAEEIANDAIDQDCDGVDLEEELTCHISIDPVNEVSLGSGVTINWEVQWFLNGERIVNTWEYGEIPSYVYIQFTSYSYSLITERLEEFDMYNESNHGSYYLTIPEDYDTEYDYQVSIYADYCHNWTTLTIK